MDIDLFPRHELPTVLRVLRTALQPRDEVALTSAERRFLGTYAFIAGEPLPPADLPPIAVEQAVVSGPHARRRLLQLAALAVLLARPLRGEAVAFLHALARQLRTHDSALAVVDALHRGRTLRARFIVARRGMRAFVREAWLAEGAMGVVRMYAAMFFKRAVNRDHLWKFRRLGLLPEGTLGRSYWRHMTEAGFGFPGEPAGIPAPMAFHDVLHVLADNATTPAGEIQQASFQGGNRRDDGFFFVLFAVLQFHHGVRMTPVTPARVDLFEPERVLWAIHRGACCHVDMTHQWDFWPLMALPLPEVRARLGLLPKLA
ncbi:MAG: hypothetical protein KIT17_17600 [Rubrivivax sp.]|nr:hypothetical protein [Rubrivivax sp.]